MTRLLNRVAEIRLVMLSLGFRVLQLPLAYLSRYIPSGGTE